MRARVNSTPVTGVVSAVQPIDPEDLMDFYELDEGVPDEIHTS